MKILLASLIMLSTVVADLSSINTCYNDPASLQLPNYKEMNTCNEKILTCSNGAPVEKKDTIALNANLMSRGRFLDTAASMVRQRIPDRPLHVKGAGAFGYFEVTHDITQYCKAKLFSKIGKRTPIFVRFSVTNQEKGEPDTTIDSRGFAIKCYTEDGIWDIPCLNVPIFFSKEPALFPSVIRIARRNPVTNTKDENMFWDFICHKPETLPFFLYIFGDNGMPDGYRHMPGYCIHTYQVYNCEGISHFIRIVILPQQGIKNICLDEAAKISCLDPDYSARDLYNAIANCNHPTYIVNFQVLTAEQVNNCSFDVFDVTKWLPFKDFPLIPVGKLVLNRNPKNYFADVEQAAFCPGNLVPGILGSPDKLFETRQCFYADAQRYRLGVNYQNIPVNCPLNTVYTYNRDGRAPIPDKDIDGPNYYPNSYNGPLPYVDCDKPDLIIINQCEDSHNYDQTIEMYKNMSDEERTRMACNLVSSLKRAHKKLQDRVLKLLASILPDFSFRVGVKLAVSTKHCNRHS